MKSVTHGWVNDFAHKNNFQLG